MTPKNQTSFIDFSLFNHKTFVSEHLKNNLFIFEFHMKGSFVRPKVNPPYKLVTSFMDSPLAVGLLFIFIETVVLCTSRIIYFSVVWSFIALKWLLSTVYFQEDDYKNWDPHLKLTKAVLASICLDVLLAGSEIFHKVRLEMRKRRQTTEAAQEVEMLNHPPPPQSRA